MTRALAVAGCFGLVLAGYFAGTVAGVSVGVDQGTRRTDWEWARFLENGMVGPGSTFRPGTVPALTDLGD